MDYVRKANTHLASVAADREVEEPPAGSVSVIAAHSRLVDPDAVAIAAPHLYLTTTDIVIDRPRCTPRLDRDSHERVS